jgi:hypothetical protein
VLGYRTEHPRGWVKDEIVELVCDAENVEVTARIGMETTSLRGAQSRAELRLEEAIAGLGQPHFRGVDRAVPGTPSSRGERNLESRQGTLPLAGGEAVSSS